jgi:putative ABC transport system ATP-binding protein
LSRAFVNEPQVIFADEPTGNLDTKTTFEMMDLITGMARERNQTLIIVTHDTEISQYADQVIHMRDGNIESIKDVEKIEKHEETSENENDDENEKSCNGNDDGGSSDKRDGNAVDGE